MQENNDTEAPKTEVEAAPAKTAKSGNGLKIAVVVLALVVVGLGAYIAVDKLVLSKNNDKKEDDSSVSRAPEKPKEELKLPALTGSDELIKNAPVKSVRVLPWNKSIVIDHRVKVKADSDNAEVKTNYAPAVNTAGFMASPIENDEKAVSLVVTTYAAEVYGQKDEVLGEHVLKIDEPVRFAYFGEFGHDSEGTELIVVSVEGNLWRLSLKEAYETNKWELKKIDAVSQVESVVNVDAYTEQTGWRTALAYRADGTYYDLSYDEYK